MNKIIKSTSIAALVFASFSGFADQSAEQSFQVATNNSTQVTFTPLSSLPEQLSINDSITLGLKIPDVCHDKPIVSQVPVGYCRCFPFC